MAKEYGISKQAFSKHMEKIPQTRAVAAFVRALIHSRDGHDALKKSRMLARDRKPREGLGRGARSLAADFPAVVFSWHIEPHIVVKRK